jgi:gamma-glutamyltranspeptidase/glutathione hydrolase
MVAAAHPLASDAGRDILAAGGNAYDAAVAASFVISVVRPQSTGIGGGGFLIGYDAAQQKSEVYDFRERAPAGATRDMFVDKDGKAVGIQVGGAEIPAASVNGPRAVAVPGLVLGLLAVHKAHGKLPLAQVMAPAIAIAADGFPIYPGLAKAIHERAAIMGKFPATARIFLPGGKEPKAGSLLVQKDLAATLRQIAAHGAEPYYHGAIAERIVAEQQRDGGLITAKDLATYQVRMRDPLVGTYRGYKIVSMPPPSSGGPIILEILNILAGDDFGALGWGTVKSTHLLAEAMRRAFADRAEFMGDPDFVKVPLAGLTSPAYGKALRAQIDLTKATPSAAVKPGNPLAYEHGSTSHLSVVDSWGNAVSTTQTVNLTFGSCVVADGTGIILNDEMDDFTKKPGAENAFGLVGQEANVVAPGKTPLSSMAPTLVFAPDGKLRLVLGSPGGPRIINATLQTILNTIDFHMTLADAVHASRIHHQWMPDQLRFEDGGLSPAVAAELTKMGHHLESVRAVGDVQAIGIDGSVLTGVSDTRSEGAARGL